MESIRLSIEIESIDRRAWSGVGVELESRWNLEFDRLKRRVATITWDWIPILDGVRYPFLAKAIGFVLHFHEAKRTSNFSLKQ